MTYSEGNNKIVVVFGLRERGAPEYMSHLSYSKTSEAVLHHLDNDLSASKPVCFPNPCFVNELSQAPLLSQALIYILVITHF